MTEVRRGDDADELGSALVPLAGKGAPEEITFELRRSLAEEGAVLAPRPG